MLITWKRYAGHSCSNETTPQMHGLHCMGCTAWGCTALGCTAWVALHGVALHGAALHGVALLEATLHGTALHVHGLHCIGCMFFLFGGEEGAILLRRVCIIKPQFIIVVINADCRMTKS